MLAAMSADDEKRAVLIEAIYGAAAEPARWDAVLDAITRHFDGASAALGVLGNAQQISFVHRNGVIGDPEMASQYQAYYGRFDPWPRERARRPVGDVALTSQVFDPEDKDHAVFVNEFFLPAGLVDSIGTALLRDDQNVALLGIQRGRQPGVFAPEDVPRLAALVPHLATALRVQRALGRLGQSNGLAELMLDRLAIGVLAVGPAGEVTHANAAAERILARRDGLQLDSRALVARDHRANDRLGKLLAEVLAPVPGAGGMVQARRAGASSGGYAMLIAPLRRDPDGGSFPWPFRGALVLIRDDVSANDGVVEQLNSLYGLTVEQARLVHSLLEGATLLEHAERAGVRPTTARFHLRHVLQRTGTASQAQLMRKVVGDLAGLPLLR